MEGLKYADEPVSKGQLTATCSTEPQAGKTLDGIFIPHGLFNGSTLLVFALIAFVVLVAAAWQCVRMRRRRKREREIVKGYAEYLPYDSAFEIKMCRLPLGPTVGTGAFGMVLKAKAYGIVAGGDVTAVAVKMATKNRKNRAALKALASELKIMVDFGQHLNVVKLLEACTKDLTNPLVLVEYCRHGNLRSYLKKRTDFIDLVDPETGVYLPIQDVSQGKNHGDCSTSDLFWYAFQVAKGMEYLTSRNVVHGDLAARNVLLADDNIVKICDSWLSKTVHQDLDANKSEESNFLPIKWMAVESIQEGTFSKESDVWSYGVFLWELFSLAQLPYEDITQKDQADSILLSKLEDGHRLQQPRYATSTIYKVMTDCWQKDPCRRPRFAQLARTLSPIVNVADHLLYNQKNGFYPVMNGPRPNDDVYNDYLQMFNCTQTLLKPPAYGMPLKRSEGFKIID